MNKKILIIMIALIIIVSATFIYYKTEREMSIIQLYDQEGPEYLSVYKYLIQSPLIEEREFIGDKNAHLTAIMIIDFDSENNLAFYNTVLSNLKKNYVDTKQMKLYFKYYITKEEYEEKKGRFINAFAAQCYISLGGNHSFEINKNLIKSVPENASSVAGAQDITKTQIEDCMNNAVPRELYKDMIETEKFRIISPSLQIGIDGEDNTIITGNNEGILNRTIRSKQIKIGI